MLHIVVVLTVVAIGAICHMICDKRTDAAVAADTWTKLHLVE
jgi:hypothetical protein